MAAESIAWYQARIAHLERLVTSRAFLTDYVPREALEEALDRGDDLWTDLQQAYRAVAVAADEARDLRAEVARLQETNLYDLYRETVGERNLAQAATRAARRELEDLRAGTHPTHRVTLKSLGDPTARDAHYDAIIARLDGRGR